MRYDNLRAFEKHLKSSTPKHLSPVYAIIGKEDYECQEAVELLKSFLIPNEKDKFNLKVVQAEILEEAHFLDDLYSYSFFSQKPVILIQGAEKLKKSILEKVQVYLSGIELHGFLIFVASALSRQTNLYKLFEKQGVILEFAELKPWEKEKYLVEAILKKAAKEKKIISMALSQEFVKRVGLDYYTISQEFEKLLCFIGENSEITRQDILAISSPTFQGSIWQLGEAIFLRKFWIAIKIIQQLLIEGSPLLQILRQLRSQFVTESQLATYLQMGKSKEELIKEFPYMKGQILDKHLMYIELYGLKNFLKGILEIDHLENALKNSELEERLSAEILMVKLTKNS